jgi:hypothetical protein
MEDPILSTGEDGFEEGDNAVSILILLDGFQFLVELANYQVVHLVETQVQLPCRI